MDTTARVGEEISSLIPAQVTRRQLCRRAARAARARNANALKLSAAASGESGQGAHRLRPDPSEHDDESAEAALVAGDADDCVAHLPRLLLRALGDDSAAGHCGIKETDCALPGSRWERDQPRRERFLPFGTAYPAAPWEWMVSVPWLAFAPAQFYSQAGESSDLSMGMQLPERAAATRAARDDPPAAAAVSSGATDACECAPSATTSPAAPEDDA